MKSGFLWSCVAALALLASGLVLGGCTYNRVQLAGGKTFSIERVESNPIYISWVYAEEKNEEMIIKGLLRTNSSNTHGTGHIDVAVFGPGGELLGQTSTDYAQKEFRKYRREARFETRFPLVPPDGSKIRVALHRLQKIEKGDSDCGNNQAAKENTV
ncbi:MAG: hypothetical protein C4576_03095 [Desulfobacteraceae bacterium]|nr:MAG: hypothetical protein C4576_03095 [Desulfobacteraceae bacterium]